MKYRSRTDITAQILDAANGGTSKTKIMYKAYLSYGQLKEYFGVLSESGLIEYETGTQLYRTTQKGLQYMKTYTQMSDMTGPMVEIKASSSRSLY